MNIVFFSHPDFAGHQSMPRFTRMLATGMEQRGHQVQIWSPPAKFFGLRAPQSFKKWMGYIDQYLVFPSLVRKRLRSATPNTLFVYTDHALGPWVPLTAKRPHLIHCHDFLAQRSALGQIPENPTSRTGKYYQAFIRRGYKQGKNFISVSRKTQDDLHQFVSPAAVNSHMVYNGLNNSFEPTAVEQSRQLLGKNLQLNLSAGYILHVGGNQWYKNRPGVIEIYDTWRSQYSYATVPLLMIGETPAAQMIELRNQSAFKKDIHFLTKVEDAFVRYAYAGASLFLFPSLAEGFGWPVAEAMACGCPVITTNEAPMTEVAGDAGFLIKKRPSGLQDVELWKREAADVINQIVSFTSTRRNEVINKALENAKRFDSNVALDSIEKHYLAIVAAGSPDLAMT